MPADHHAQMLGAGIFAPLGSCDILARYCYCCGSGPNTADRGLGCGFSHGPATMIVHHGSGSDYRSGWRICRGRGVGRTGVAGRPCCGRGCVDVGSGQARQSPPPLPPPLCRRYIISPD